MSDYIQLCNKRTGKCWWNSEVVALTSADSSRINARFWKLPMWQHRMLTKIKRNRWERGYRELKPLRKKFPLYIIWKLWLCTSHLVNHTSNQLTLCFPSKVLMAFVCYYTTNCCRKLNNKSTLIHCTILVWLLYCKHYKAST